MQELYQYIEGLLKAPVYMRKLIRLNRDWVMNELC